MEDLSLKSLFDISGKNVVVTGGSKGIGFMISSAFVQAGCKVFMFSRKPDHEAAKKLTDIGPGTCFSMVCDVTDEKAIEKVVDTVGKECPEGIHCLVNNSGAVWAEAFETTSKKSFDKIMNLNVTAVFMVTQKFGDLLKKTASKQDPARVINIASIDGIGVPTFEEYAYAASKAGVAHMTRVMAGQLASQNMTFNAISPGLFPSKMGDQVLKAGGDAVVDAIPLGRAGSAKDIAGCCLYLAGPTGAFTSGANIIIDGAMNAKPRM